MGKLRAHVKRAFLLWKMVTIIVLSVLLIPLALSRSDDAQLWFWTISLSVLGYVALITVARRMKGGKPRRYLETTGNRLLLGLAALAAAALLLGNEKETWGKALLVASAVLYAFFLQRISFLKVIGL